MSLDIENEYQTSMDSLTPAERISRSVAMFNWSRELIGRQVMNELGSISEERLKWEVALRQYGSDPDARSVIERKLADVSG